MNTNRTQNKSILCVSGNEIFVKYLLNYWGSSVDVIDINSFVLKIEKKISPKWNNILKDVKLVNMSALLEKEVILNLDIQ